MRKLSCKVAAGWVLFILLAVGANAADVSGSKDPPGLKRFAGSEIVYSMSRSFDQYQLIVPDNSDPNTPGKTKTEAHEGTVQRLLYRVPDGHTALELLRNYESAAKEAGLQVAYEMAQCRADLERAVPDAIFHAVDTTGFSWNLLLANGGGQTIFSKPNGPFCYFTAKGSISGQDVGLTVAVVEERDPSGLTTNIGNYTPPQLTFKLGEILVLVDTVSAKALENNMVFVSAADMADSLATKGSVDLYGILFDTDKTDIKPDSAKTLQEVANLLKIDRSLKLEISGHTDNTGDKAHNITLSEGRAKAVVDVLVKQYGIDPSRLQAKGYGDTKPVAPNDTDANKAKNRRVELKKL